MFYFFLANSDFSKKSPFYLYVNLYFITFIPALLNHHPIEVNLLRVQHTAPTAPRDPDSPELP